MGNDWPVGVKEHPFEEVTLSWDLKYELVLAAWKLGRHSCPGTSAKTGKAQWSWVLERSRRSKMAVERSYRASGVRQNRGLGVLF